MLQSSNLSPVLRRSQRRELVTYLAGEGMSTRAIAPVVGTDQSTVVRDVQAPDANASPAHVEASGDRSTPHAEPTVQVAARSVIGLDGHTYPAVDRQTGEITPTAPSVPRRKPWLRSPRAGTGLASDGYDTLCIR